MKINGVVVFSLLSLVSGSLARRGNRFGAYDENEPLQKKSRVTAFVVTENGPKVECWEMDDLMPQTRVTRADGSKGAFSESKMSGLTAVSVISFGPHEDIFSLQNTQVHSNAIDFTASPNLFTVKDGLIWIEVGSVGDATAQLKDDVENHIFSLENGDDWFYFEDQSIDSSSSSSSGEQCAKSRAESSTLNVRTISGSDTTLINFKYDTTPGYTVLHEGACNFAGLKPGSSSSKSDPDSGKSRFRSQSRN